MKRISIFVFIIALVLSACAVLRNEARDIADVTKTAANVTRTSETAPPKASAISSPAPQPTPLYNTDIPDVININDEPVINSGRRLYEDDVSVYFLSPWYTSDELFESHNGLFRINKSDGEYRLIAKDVSCFTLSGGKIYYATGEMGESEILCNTVNCYDVKTGKTSLVFQRNEAVYEIAVYNKRIYYAVDPHPEIEKEFYSDLFSCRMDGGGRKLVVKEPDNFCIYNNRIYYMSGAYSTDGTPVFQCSINGSNVRRIVEWASIWEFEISNDTLIYIGDYGSLIVQNLKSGKQQTILSGYSDFALLGQYIVAHDDVFCAYDVRDGKIYRLANLEYDTYDETDMYTGKGCVWLSVHRAQAQDISFKLYLLTIENGCASLSLFAQV